MVSIQRVLMAVMCTVLKTCAVQDQVCGHMPLRELLAHLFRLQARVQEIFVTERQVLHTLDFMVTAPAPNDFLDALTAPLQVPSVEQHGTKQPADGSPHRCIANFLLQLSLFSANVHYGYPHAILAASAVHIALASLQAAPAQFRTLLGDVSLACPDVKDVPSTMAAWSTELHGLWVEFADSRGARTQSILKKFGNSAWLHAILSPPPLRALPHPATFAPAAHGHNYHSNNDSIGKTAATMPIKSV